MDVEAIQLKALFMQQIINKWCLDVGWRWLVFKTMITLVALDLSYEYI